MKFVAALALSLLCTAAFAKQKQFTLKSPNDKLQVQVSVGNTLSYTVTHDGDVMLEDSPISMSLLNGAKFGVSPKLSGTSQKSVNQTIASPLYKRTQIEDKYNELRLSFSGSYMVIFRAYNEGIAYRFVSTSKKPIKVKGEEASFSFPSDSKVYAAYVKGRRGASFEQQFFNSFENEYTYMSLSEWDRDKLAFLPVLVEGANGKKVLITEADLLNYPGMYLNNSDGGKTLKGVFAPYPKDIKQGGHNDLQGVVESHENYIAKYNKGEAFPWRVIAVSDQDIQLADNDLVYKLASPCLLKDFAWVKPGKVAWEWWNDWNLKGVNFKTGVNNETYKYYIDFASREGIEYVILDEGWSVNREADLLKVVPEINLKELVDYAKSKNVGIILWAGYYALNRDLENVCKHYSEMGVKGFKVDFMDRDDQEMMQFYPRAAAVAAKYNLMLDYHGTSKPTGLNRTYPNVINYEGVRGLENMKWALGPSEKPNPTGEKKVDQGFGPGTAYRPVAQGPARDVADQVTYDVTIPFIRMFGGPMDYTQGAMRNASLPDYFPIYSEPMSQGTRCRQLAEYVVFESPLNMLCDNPSNYMREEECTHFIAQVPTTWDETRALNGAVAQYVTIARRKGNDWYVGAMTNWDARTIEIDLTFLGGGQYKAELFRDGVNADRAASDYIKETIDIPTDKKLKVDLASGGGCVLRICKK